jgi:hypothetical protein
MNEEKRIYVIVAETERKKLGYALDYLNLWS